MKLRSFVGSFPSSLHVSGLLVGTTALVLAACAPEFEQSHEPSARGTLGAEVFTALCDRVGAGELREDLTGASFRALCHDDGAGYADAVDVNQLPPLTGDEVNDKGETITLATQEEERARRVKRVETFAQKRDSIIHAIDTIIPDAEMLVRTLEVDDSGQPVRPENSCNVSKKPGNIQTELAGLLGNFGKLYADGTIPDSTQALARTLAVFRDSAEAREAWGRLSVREGYRPASVGLGVIRPFAAYPQLRELLTALISQVSSDSRPYEEVNGQHLATPGPSYLRFVHLLDVTRHEMDNATADPVPPALRAQDVADAEMVHLSRPRENLEMMQALMLAEDSEFGGGAPRFIVRRDHRGMALLPGTVAAPFKDDDDDGLPDLDSLGRFVTTTGQLAPSPFPIPGKDSTASRDNFGRATVSGDLAYAFVDTSHTFTASLLQDSLPLFNPDPAAQHETMMDALAGLYVVAGARDGGNTSNKTYADGSTIAFDAFKKDRSPLLDLVHAAAQLIAEPTVDDTLVLAKHWAQNNEADLARVMKAVLEGRDIANRHPEAVLAKTSTLWDDLFELLGRMSTEPGLLEDLLDSLTHDDTLKLGTLLGKWATYADEYSYSRTNLSGPAVNRGTGTSSEPVKLVDPNQADSGDNRSMLQRFLQLMSDGRGVASCNQAGAQVKAHAFTQDITIPFLGETFAECEVYKVNDLDVFLLQAMVESPKARLYIRNGTMRNGQFAGVGKATVGLMEDSSGMRGFFTPRDSTDLRPTPQWLARKVFFDLNEEAGPNQRTKDFILALDGKFTGSSVCRERVIDDPCAKPGNDCTFDGDVSIPYDVAADGKVRGLRSCQDGDWLAQRNPNTLFMMEALDAYRAFTPMAKAFVDHDREDLFIDLAIILHKHWQTERGTESECKTNTGPCSKSGASTYQALLGEMLVRDTIPALANLMKTAKAQTIRHCTSVDDKGVCTSSEERSGLTVLAEAARAMFDPARSARVDLRDRQGNVSTKKNDGSAVAQVTPVYLLTNALAAIDTAYDEDEAAHPDQPNRRAQFRRARSQLADQFMAISGEGASARFASRGVIKMMPILIDLLRSQAWANCPRTFGDGTLRCKWARDELTKKLEDTVSGPMFAAAMDLADGLRRDDRTRQELQRAAVYLMDAASQNEALPSMLASANDIVQILRDDRNLLPFYKVLAAALNTQNVVDGEVKKSLVDSMLTLLGRVAGRYENVTADDQVVEICSREIDPNQVLNVLMGTAVTPSDVLGGKAPIEVLLDVIADVNRVAPEEPKENYDEADYQAISGSVVEFLTNEERGMEQFYAIVRKGQNKQ